MNGQLKKPLVNGSGKRKNESWIESFIEATSNLEAPRIFRQWTAITTIASVLEQKVWVRTSRPLFPNIYALIVGHPGVGKTRTIREGRRLVHDLPDFHLAPVSLTFASLVDSLTQAKRMLVRLPDEPLEYNSMFICADELGAFIHKYDDEMIAGLSAFYDPDPYSQTRRTRDISIKIKSPQLNILAGSTPSNLMKFMPEGAWDQGFTSRLIMIFSDERIIGDDFASKAQVNLGDLEYDLRTINSLVGEFEITADYRDCVNNWRALGEPPTPSHPKLIHYVTRRRAHLYKLSIIAAIDRSNALILTREDFNTALNWLVEAERMMPEIFKAGVMGADASAMEEIMHFVQVSDHGHGVTESRITKFASERLPINSVYRVVDIMEKSGMLKSVAVDRLTGFKVFKAIRKNEQISKIDLN